MACEKASWCVNGGPLKCPAAASSSAALRCKHWRWADWPCDALDCSGARHALRKGGGAVAASACARPVYITWTHLSVATPGRAGAGAVKGARSAFGGRIGRLCLCPPSLLFGEMERERIRGERGRRKRRGGRKRRMCTTTTRVTDESRRCLRCLPLSFVLPLDELANL